MTLNDKAFEEKIIQIQDEMIGATDYEASKQMYAVKLVEAVKVYLMSGTVTINGTSSQGPFTGTGTIS